jgi:serine O-acetyltransferase
LRGQILEDWETNYRDWTQPGFRALAVYRFGVWRQDLPSGVLQSLASMLYRCMFRYVRNHYGIELPATTIVGRKLRLAHQGGIVIHPYAVIGDNCLIRHNVTIGAVSDDRWREAPTLGNRVQVGCGAAILGPVTIGDGVRIGANAVVMMNVPAGASVFAPPSRMIKLAKHQEVSQEVELE